MMRMGNLLFRLTYERLGYVGGLSYCLFVMGLPSGGPFYGAPCIITINIAEIIHTHVAIAARNIPPKNIYSRYFTNQHATPVEQT